MTALHFCIPRNCVDPCLFAAYRHAAS